MAIEDWSAPTCEWVAVIGPFEEVFDTFDDVAAFVSWVDDGCPAPDEHPAFARAWGMENTSEADDPEHEAEHEAIKSQSEMRTFTAHQQRKRSNAARNMLAQHLERFHGQSQACGNRRQLESRHAKLHGLEG